MKTKTVLTTLFLVALTKSILFSHYGFGLLDEGESLHNAQRILSGDLPYQDFFAIFPPLDNYFYALVFKLFGESVVIPRIVASAIFTFVPPLIFLIAKRFMPPLYALFPALLIIFLDVNIERLYFFTPLLFGFYIFLLALDQKKQNLFFLSGLLFGLTSLIRFDIPGTFILATVLGGALHLFILSRKEWFRRWWHFFLPMGAGFVLPMAAMALWMLRQGIFEGFINSAFVQSVAITKLHSLPFPSVLDLAPRSGSLFDLSRAYTSVYGYSLLTVYVITMVLLMRQGRVIWRKTPGIGIFLFAGVFALPYIFGRSEIGHMVKGGMPFLFLGTFLMYRANKILPVFPRTAIWMAVAGIFVANIFQSLWWIKFNDQAIAIRGHNLRLNSNYFAGSTLPSGETITESVEFIRENTKRGEPIVTLPYMAGLYFLSARPSPTQYNNLLAGFITTEEGERDFIRKIEESKAKIVMYDPNNGPKMKTPLLSQYNPLIHKYILENFQIVRETKEGWLFMKKNE